jgi:hypothetical protein
MKNFVVCAIPPSPKMSSISVQVIVGRVGQDIEDGKESSKNCEKSVIQFELP